MQYNKLTVHYVAPDNNNCYCCCECGNYIATTLSSLTVDEIYSCGCTRPQSKSTTPLYHKWKNLKNDCTNKNSISRPYLYGKLYPEWYNSTNFINWALANGYIDGMILSFKDKYAGANPDNCYWKAPGTIDKEMNTSELTSQRQIETADIIEGEVYVNENPIRIPIANITEIANTNNYIFNDVNDWLESLK